MLFIIEHSFIRVLDKSYGEYSVEAIHVFPISKPNFVQMKNKIQKKFYVPVVFHNI